MSKEKKAVREAFRAAVFGRDGWRCRVCGAAPSASAPLDAHHVIDRHDMPNGGYVAENGISLCPPCHLKAEAWNATGAPVPGYSPDELFALIGSSLDAALEASEALG